MAGRDILLEQIRIMGRGSRGASPAILDLSDTNLHDVFEQMQRGLSSRAIARHLRKIGMSGSENSLQQAVSLLRKRIAPLLKTDAAVPSLPSSVLKIPAEVSSLPADEMLSTVTDIVQSYGESIRQVTKAAAETGAPIGEDIAKHVKAYSALVATKARLEQTVRKTRPPDPVDDVSFRERADRAWDYLTDGGRNAQRMAKAAEKFIARLEKKCICLTQDSNGEYVRVPDQRPRRSERR